MNRKAKITIVVVATILLATMFVVIPKPTKADAFDGTYYGYGDSIVGGLTEPLNPDGSEGFILYMQDSFDPTNTSSRNIDGGGKSSSWGYSNIGTHVTDWGNCIIEAFGVNDYYIDGLTADESAQYKMLMYNLSISHDSQDHYYPCINTLADPSNGMRPWNTQFARINATEQLFKRYCVRYVPLYDALDLVPLNGVCDGFYDDSTYIDYVHPNAAGNVLMAELLWTFISGSDYTETRSIGNITINADYNETVYIEPLSGWEVNDVTITCVENSTEINYDIRYDVSGNKHICFDIHKNHNYVLTSGTTVSYYWEDQPIHHVAGNETSGMYYVRECREIVYVDGVYYLYARYSYDLSYTNYGYLLATTTDFETIDDIQYITPYNALGDGGYPNWATDWYNPYTNEIWFWWNKMSSSSSRAEGSYLTRYNLTTETWTYDELWKSAESINGQDMGNMFCYEPITHEWDGNTRLIMPITFTHKTSGDVGPSYVGIYYSDDFGQTWSCRHDVTNDMIYVPNQPIEDLEENSIVELPNGSLCMNIRLQNWDWNPSYPAMYMWRSFSHDHGMTWTEAERVDNVPISVSKHLLRNATLDGRNVYIMFAHHRPEGWDVYNESWCNSRIRSNLSLRISYDGVNWEDTVHIIHPDYWGQGYDGTGLFPSYGSFICMNDTLYCCAYVSESICGSPTDLKMFKVKFYSKLDMSNPSIENNTINVTTTIENFTIDLNDRAGDTFDWSIECSNGDSASGVGDTNGTKVLTFSNLYANTEYAIWVNSSSAWYNKKYVFNTELSMSFVRIGGVENGSVFNSNIPTLNWSVINHASKYQLQIATEPAFTDLVLNYTDINIYNYPSNLQIINNIVSFTIPDADAFTSYDILYFRVRAYVKR